MIKHLQTTKRLLALLFALFCGMQMGWAYDFYAFCPTGQRLYYTIIDITNNYVEVTNSNNQYGPTGEMVIPLTVVNGSITYTVTSIGNSAFYRCINLTSVEIPNSVTSIDVYAFYGCSGLTSVSIGNSVTSIGIDAFENCTGLTSVEIPDSVTSIGSWAFYGCSGLTSVSIGNSVTSIGQYAFGGCSNLTSVILNSNAIASQEYIYLKFGSQIASFTFGPSVTSIGYRAFYGCTSLTSVSIGNSVTSIGGEAFSGCSGLISVTIGNSVTSIGGSAFYDCSSLSLITSCPMTPPVLGDAVFEGVPNSVVVYVPCGTTELYQAAEGWSDFNDYFEYYCPIDFADANVKAICVTYWDADGDGELCYEEAAMVTDLGTYFKGNTGITSFDELRYFTGLTSVGDNAFSGCSGLTSVEIPNSVTSIGQYAFSGCSGLTSVEIPDSVTSMGQYAFSGCSGLTSVEIPNSVTSIGYRAFSGCSGLTSVEIPNSVISIGQYAFGGCSGLTSVILNSNAIASQNYIYDNNLKKIFGAQITNFAFGPSVTSIGASVFYGCTSLTSVSIGNSVKSIGNLAFYGCSNLTSVTLNSNAVASASYNQGNNLMNIFGEQITNFTFGPSVTSIGYRAFYGCSGLALVIIGDSVTSIGRDAFYGCSGLTSVEIPNSVTLIGDRAFYDCSGLTSVSIGNSVTTIEYGTAFNGCSNLTSVILNSNAIASQCYMYLLFGSQIASFTFGPSVTSIRDYALSGCSGLTSITSYALTPPAVGDNTFENVPTTAVVHVPCCTIESYQTASGWSGFTTYEGFDDDHCAIIDFADDNVKAICVAQWDTNGDGELSKAEANAVTSLGTDFAFSDITSFEELQYFTSLTTIEDDVFFYCGSLNAIAFPSSLTSIGDAFSGCSNLMSITSFSTVPPTVGANAFQDVPASATVHVPCSYTSLYQSALGWNGFTNYEEFDAGDVCPIVFADAHVKALCVSNWDTDGNGELSYVEAAAVTSLGEVFSNNSIITSFDELQYFTGLTSVGDNAFEGCANLTSIEIPNTVASIGDNAFEGCTNLTSIEIPNAVVSIGNGAFEGCANLTSIEIPNEVVSIGDNAFANCSTITSITFPDGLTAIGNGAFEGCTGLASVHYMGSVAQWCGITFPSATSNPVHYAHNLYIDDRVLISDNFNAYTVGNKIAVEAQTAGSDWWTTWSNNPGSATDGVVAEYGGEVCGHLTFNNDQVLLLGGVESGTYDLEFDILVPNGKNGYFNILHEFNGGSSKIAMVAWLHMTNDGQNSTQAPGHGTIHAGSTGTADIPCVYDEWMHFRIHVDIDGDFAEFFYSTETTYPNEQSLCTWQWSLDRFGNNVVGPKLNAMDFWPPTSDDEFYLDNFTFTRNSSSVTDLSIPTSVSAIPDYAFDGCTSIISLTLPSSVTSIGDGAFEGCTNLTAVEFPNTVVSIGDNSFANCSTISSITFPVGLTAIGNGAFGGCTGLTSVHYLGSIEQWCGLTFPSATSNPVHYAHNLYISDALVTDLSIPTSVSAIPDYAFDGCTSIMSLTLPSSVTSIGNGAFGGCSNMASINANRSTPPTVGANAFEGVNTRIPITLPCGALAAYQAASGWNVFSNYYDECAPIVFADDNVKAICVANWDTDSDGELSYVEAAEVTDFGVVFKNNTDITSFDELQYFTALTSLPNMAFMGCTNLVSISLPSSIASLGNGAFFNCTSLSVMTVYAETPPTAVSNTFGNVPSSLVVKVPCGTSDAYQAATGWDSFSNIVEMCGAVTQTIALSEGWNWISTNVEITLDDLKEALVDALPGTEISIKSKDRSATYNGVRWRGTLNAMDVSKMYMVKTSAACEIALTGMPVNPAEHAVTINYGVNWIGFPRNGNMSLADAFVGFAANGDMVKSKNISSSYNGTRWRGTLNTLEPGQGYIYKSVVSGDRVFTFPVSGKCD